MKKLVFVAVATLCALSAFADEVSGDDAMTAVAGWVNVKAALGESVHHVLVVDDGAETAGAPLLFEQLLGHIHAAAHAEAEAGALGNSDLFHAFGPSRGSRARIMSKSAWQLCSRSRALVSSSTASSAWRSGAMSRWVSW